MRGEVGVRRDGDDAAKQACVQSRGVLKTPEAGVTHAVIRANATVSLDNTSFWSPVRESGWFSSSSESSVMPGRPIAPQHTRMSIAQHCRPNRQPGTVPGAHSQGYVPRATLVRPSLDPATSAAVRVNASSWLQRRQNLPEATGAAQCSAR